MHTFNRVNLFLNKVKYPYSVIKSNAVLWTNYLLIIYAFFLPISKEISNIAFSFIIFLFVIDGNFKDKVLFILEDKVVVAILLFVLMHILWLFGTDDFSYASNKLSFMKYFVSIILFVTMIKKEFIIKIISAFMLAMFFSEICSYLIFFNIIEPFNNATRLNPVPFMLNHGFYATFLSLSLGILLFNLFKRQISNHLIRFIILIFSVTITINIFIISSRLGYILFSAVLFSMIIIFFKEYLIRVIFVTIVISSLSYSIAYQNITNFKTRINQALSDIYTIKNNQNYTTSTGIRYGFHIFSLNIFKDNQLFGVGTGDHINYIKKQIKDSPYLTPKNMLNILNQGKGSTLHSDYLDIFVQFGLVGLLIFMNIFYQILKYRQNNFYFKSLQILVIVVFLINAISQGMIYFSVLNKVFILFIALTLCLYQDKKTC